MRKLPSVGSGTGDTSNVQVVNLAMADTDQASSFTTTPSLTGTEVGIITFKVVRNQGLWTGSNVSDSQLRQAVGGGAPIGVFTGADDVTSYVYVAGRDTASGTRDNFLDDIQYGSHNAVGQIELSGGLMQLSGNTGTYVDTWGQSSGGTLAKSITYNTSTTADPQEALASGGANNPAGFSVISYLGYSDASTALAGTGGGAGRHGTHLGRRGLQHCRH